MLDSGSVPVQPLTGTPVSTLLLSLDSGTLLSKTPSSPSVVTPNAPLETTNSLVTETLMLYGDPDTHSAPKVCGNTDLPQLEL